MVSSDRFTAVTASDAPVFPQWLKEESLFWLVFGTWTVLPSTKNPVLEIGAGVRVLGTDVALVFFTFLYLLPRLIAPRSFGRWWHRGLPVALLGICAYGIFSTTWSGGTVRELLAMRYTMVVSAASGLFAYMVITSVTDVRAFLRRLVLALATVCLLYTAQSFLGLGLRSAEAVTLNDFGMERVRGPLFESSTGYFLLIPALAFALEETLWKRFSPLHGLGSVFALAVTILGLGSRAGYAILGVFAAMCVSFLKGRQRIAAIVVLGVVGGASALLIFSKANTNRLQFETKGARELTHETSLEIVEARPLLKSISGSGLGSWWPWYVTESDGGDIYLTGRFLRRTPYGILLYHSHSTILMMLVELGLPGVLFLLVVGATLGGAFWRAIKLKQDRIFACGLLVSGLSLDMDLFLVRRPTRDAVWWLLLFGCLALLEQNRRNRSVSIHAA